MPVVGNKEHGTGEAAQGTAGEEGLQWVDGMTPEKTTENYGAGDGGTGPQVVTEGESSRSTPLKGSK